VYLYFLFRDWSNFWRSN